MPFVAHDAAPCVETIQPPPAAGKDCAAAQPGGPRGAKNILYSLQHLGYSIPPQADAGWIGEAGPGPSYLDPGSGGPENDFANATRRS